MKVVSLSENTVAILFDQSISKQTAAEILKLRKLIDKAFAEYVIDIIPSYTSIHLSFNPRKIRHQSFVEKLTALTQQTAEIEQDESQQRRIEIPVYYGEEVGLDLQDIAEKSGLSIEQIIQMHSEKIYAVFALGFSPGFAYLGSVDTPIAIPRKETPRLAIAKGSLGIAGEQTAVYPFESPGGWNIIGRTPLELVDYSQQPPCIFEVGDSVKFNPISRAEFLTLGGEL